MSLLSLSILLSGILLICKIIAISFPTCFSELPCAACRRGVRPHTGQVSWIAKSWGTLWPSAPAGCSFLPHESLCWSIATSLKQELLCLNEIWCNNYWVESWKYCYKIILEHRVSTWSPGDSLSFLIWRVYLRNYFQISARLHNQVFWQFEELTC